MKALWAFCCASALLLPASAARPDTAPAEDVELLQGTWDFRSLEVEGNPLPQEAIQGWKIEVRGQNFTTSSSGPTYKGTFKVDAAKAPRTIDLAFTEGPDAGNTALGIYELNGDDWRICFDVSGKGRPQEFASRAGSGRALETLHRRAQAGGTAGAELARLEGEWAMVSAERDGQRLPDTLVKNSHRTCKGGETTVMIGSQLFMKAKITVDPSKKPKAIDYLLTDGLDKGKTQLGIYELNGDTLKTCFSAPGKPRPGDFTTAAGSGRTLSVWKRAKP